MCSEGVGYIVAILICITYVVVFTLQSSILKTVKIADESLYGRILGKDSSLFERDTLGGADLLLYKRFYQALPIISAISQPINGMCRLYRFFLWSLFIAFFTGLTLMIWCLD